ncbi:MAG: hypothetical protein ACTS4U_00835 [Candidatus Hodgkinia cicadicola]
MRWRNYLKERLKRIPPLLAQKWSKEMVKRTLEVRNCLPIEVNAPLLVILAAHIAFYFSNNRKAKCLLLGDWFYVWNFLNERLVCARF